MERCVELSYFLGVKFSRLGYRWMGGNKGNQGVVRMSLGFPLWRRKIDLALRSDVNTIPGRGCREWRILMFVPEERRELDNEVAREKRKLEMNFSPF